MLFPGGGGGRTPQGLGQSRDLAVRATVRKHLSVFADDLGLLAHEALLPGVSRAPLPHRVESHFRRRGERGGRLCAHGLCGLVPIHSGGLSRHLAPHGIPGAVRGIPVHARVFLRTVCVGA